MTILKIRNERTTFERVIIFICRLVGVFAFIGSLVMGFLYEEHSSAAFMNAFVALIFLLLTFLPSFISRGLKIALPAALQTGMIIFVFAAQILGEIRGFYERYSWWDDMLHISSGVMIGYIGFLFIYALNKDPKVYLSMNPLSLSTFAFCFALALGAIWEIFEFSMDYFFGMNMQKSIYVSDVSDWSLYTNKWGRLMDPGLIDTISDLIVDAIGALAVSVVGYFRIRSFHDTALGASPDDSNKE